MVSESGCDPLVWLLLHELIARERAFVVEKAAWDEQDTLAQQVVALPRDLLQRSPQLSGESGGKQRGKSKRKRRGGKSFRKSFDVFDAFDVSFLLQAPPLPGLMSPWPRARPTLGLLVLHSELLLRCSSGRKENQRESTRHLRVDS